MMKRILFLGWYLLLATILQAQLCDSLFRLPPRSACPSTYWMWMNGNISKEGITADLEYMKRTGYGGASIFNVGVGIPKGDVCFGTDNWNQMLQHAVREADRLGLELFLQNSPGYSGTGGPWITPEQSMQQLVWTETMAIPGKKGRVICDLNCPYAKMGYYKDAVVLAYPALESEHILFHDIVAKVVLDNHLVDEGILMDNDFQTQIRMDGQGSTLTFELSQPFEARAITVYRGDREKPLDPHDGPRDYPPLLRLEVSDDGMSYRPVATLHSPALRAMDVPSTASFTPVKSRFFRLVANRGTNLSEIDLHASARLSNWTAKTNCTKEKVSFEYDSDREESGQSIAINRIVDISDYMDEQGHLDWKAPSGYSRWMIVRIGSTTTGETVAAAPDDCIGLDCDKLDKRGVEAHFDKFLSPLLEQLRPWCGRSLCALMMDSWEVGKQNWTASLPDYFKIRNGYDVRPWMLAMTGRIVDSIEATERFLYDMRRTQTDMFNENFLSRFKELAADYGLKFAAEPYGDGNFESLEYAETVDFPMSEFWTHYIYGGVTTSKMAASTAHLWNRPIVGAECFTGTPFNSKFTEHPYAMKAEGDYMMAMGVNRFVYHVFAHQPYVGPTAGSLMTMGPFGSHLNRNSIWAEQAIGWNRYNARCSYLLQQGLFVADILFIKGEEISNGIDDYDCVDPSVPYGYRWDIGSHRILPYLQVSSGRMFLPHQMNYGLLVLPKMKRCSPELLRQVKRLVDTGASVLLPVEKPVGYMGLDEEKDREVQCLVDDLWNRVGKGNVYQTNDISMVMNDLDIKPDFSFTARNRDAQVHFIHRKVNDDEDLYFVCNHRRRKEVLTATFRVAGKYPVIWDAETGKTNLPVAYQEEDGMMHVTFSLSESGSLFFLFRHQPMEHQECFHKIEPQSALLTPPCGTFTIALWAKPETFAANGRGFLLFPDKGIERYGHQYAVVGLAMGQNAVRVYERSEANSMVMEVRTPISGWTHIVLVYRDGVPALYLNGKLAGTGRKSKYICVPAFDVEMAEEQYIGSFEGDQTKTIYADAAWTAEEIKKEAEKGVPEPELPDDCNVWKNIDGAWQVQIPLQGADSLSITLPRLESLHKHENFNVRHFSGKSVYVKEFMISGKDLKKGDRRIMLDLGRVENIAEVSLNGYPVQLLWKAPYALDITDYLKKGTNIMKIEVTNLLPNRMIRDAYFADKYEYDEYGRILQLPDWYISQKQDCRKEHYLFIPWKYYTKSDPLLESGLLGPVRLFIKR